MLTINSDRSRNSQSFDQSDGTPSSSGFAPRRPEVAPLLFSKQKCGNLAGRVLRQHPSCGQQLLAWLGTPLRNFRNWNTLRKVISSLRTLDSNFKQAFEAKPAVRESRLTSAIEACNPPLDALAKLAIDGLAEHGKTRMMAQLVAISIHLQKCQGERMESANTPADTINALLELASY